VTAAPAARARVLVADDDQDVLMLVSATLERAGYAVVRARDGAEALELAAETQPALCVLDVMMPKLDGLEVTRRLRANGGGEVRIMLLTASVQDRHRAGGLAAGADDFVRKPFSPRELVARVERLLAG
jgi:DNA-binding response OmpR family regulator